jgi:prephenate dehydratase
MPNSKAVIAYQGERGSNSHIACNEVFPNFEALPCRTFEDVFAAVEGGDARLAMIPVENTLAGRVGDIHHLLPSTSLKMIGEHYMRIRFQLMGLKGTDIGEIKRAYSHVMALGQCRQYLRERSIIAITAADTAGAARMVAERGDLTAAAIAPSLAAEEYGLDILAYDIEDAQHNTTRFVIMSRDPVTIKPEDGKAVTTFLFQVRNIPSALYKALGGFATNGVNMTKLESYQIEGSFNASQFYAEIEGHIDDPSVQLAMEELGFFSSSIKILGVYPAHPARDRFG